MSDTPANAALPVDATESVITETKIKEDGTINATKSTDIKTETRKKGTVLQNSVSKTVVSGDMDTKVITKYSQPEVPELSEKEPGSGEKEPEIGGKEETEPSKKEPELSEKEQGACEKEPELSAKEETEPRNKEQASSEKDPEIGEKEETEPNKKEPELGENKEQLIAKDEEQQAKGMADHEKNTDSPQKGKYEEMNENVTTEMCEKDGECSKIDVLSGMAKHIYTSTYLNKCESSLTNPKNVCEFFFFFIFLYILYT